MITNKSDSHKWLQIKVIVTYDYKFSRSINEVIWGVLSALFIYFFFFLPKYITRAKTLTSKSKLTKQKKQH